MQQGQKFDKIVLADNRLVIDRDGGHSSDSGLETDPRKGWGDRLKDALTKVGITTERVSDWVGGDCGCVDRQRLLNSLGFWVERVLSGKTEKAKEHLQTILDDEVSE